MLNSQIPLKLKDIICAKSHRMNFQNYLGAYRTSFTKADAEQGNTFNQGYFNLSE